MNTVQPTLDFTPVKQGFCNIPPIWPQEGLVCFTWDQVMRVATGEIGTIILTPTPLVKTDAGEMVYGISYTNDDGKTIYRYIAQHLFETSRQYVLIKRAPRFEAKACLQQKIKTK